MDFTQLTQRRRRVEVTSQRPGETIIIDPLAFASAFAPRQPQAVSNEREAQQEEKVADLQRQLAERQGRLEESQRQLAEIQGQRLVESQRQLAESRAETQAVRQDFARQLQEANRRSEAQQGPLQGLARIQRQPPRPLQHTSKWSIVNCLPGQVSYVNFATYHNHYIYAVMVTSDGEQHAWRFPVQDSLTGRWEIFRVPGWGRVNCHGFISHAGNLYTLCAAENDAVHALYKMVNDGWVLITHLPEPGPFVSGVANSKLFIVGGANSNPFIVGGAGENFPLHKVYSFSLAEENAAARTPVWENWPDLPVSHIHWCFVCVGTQAYLLLPWEEKAHVLSIDATANPGCRYWTQTLLPGTAFVDPGACRLHSTMAIAGGQDYRSATEALSRPSCTTSAFILDRDTNEWTPLPSLNMQCMRPRLLFDPDHNMLICFGGASDRSGIVSNYTMEVLQL